MSAQDRNVDANQSTAKPQIQNSGIQDSMNEDDPQIQNKYYFQNCTVHIVFVIQKCKIVATMFRKLYVRLFFFSSSHFPCITQPYHIQTTILRLLAARRVMKTYIRNPLWSLTMVCGHLYAIVHIAYPNKMLNIQVLQL